jgi:hypothetical protein
MSFGQLLFFQRLFQKAYKGGFNCIKIQNFFVTKTTLEESGRHQRGGKHQNLLGSADRPYPLVPLGLLLWAPPVIFCDLLPPHLRMHLGSTLSRFDPIALMHPTGCSF